MGRGARASLQRGSVLINHEGHEGNLQEIQIFVWLRVLGGWWIWDTTLQRNPARGDRPWHL